MFSGIVGNSFGKELGRILGKICNILFPKYCVICKIRGDNLCKKCKAQLKPYPEVCSLCNRYSRNYMICPECKKSGNFHLEQIIIGFYYNSHIKKLLLDLKYRHRYTVSEFLAGRIALLVEAYLGHTLKRSHFDQTAIIGIPSHRWRKYIVKGYNQSEILAQAAAKKLEIPYIPLLKKIKNTTSQVKLNKAQRMKNLNNCFVLKSEHQERLKNIKYLIIVDDITTTGASLNSVAKTIHQYYPHIHIYGIVLGKK